MEKYKSITAESKSKSEWEISRSIQEQIMTPEMRLGYELKEKELDLMKQHYEDVHSVYVDLKRDIYFALKEKKDCKDLFREEERIGELYNFPFTGYGLQTKMKVSFDFDGTLEHLRVQSLALKFKDLGAEVWCVTSRSKQDKRNSELYKICDVVGISRERIVFTEYKEKYSFVKEFDMHFDNDEEEIYLINEYGKTIGLLI